MAPSHSHLRGQAAIETAFALPVVLFLVLGTLQLTLIAHARILTKLAAYRATRAGSLAHGSCERMLQASLLQLMPAIEPFAREARNPHGTIAEGLAKAFALRRFNRYDDRLTDGGSAAHVRGTIVWIKRTLGGRTTDAGPNDSNFDQKDGPMRLETRLVFWFPLRVPFANWVFSRIVRASWGLQTYDAVDPLAPAAGQRRWEQNGTRLENLVLDELQGRAQHGELVFPISATWTMRMMTPLKRAHYATPCLGTPVGL